jgi:uncharacterized caspase-like protein
MKAAALLVLLCVATTAAAQEFARSFAIVIGIRVYANNNTLPNAQFDAEAIAAFLKTQQYQVTELYNQDASRAAILDAMDNVARIATSKDRVLFFFAGHGYTETRGDLERGYIVPYDGRPGQESSLIGMEQLRSESERMGNAHHQLFLMDSCYGGTIGMRDSPMGVDPRVPNYIAEITKRVAREALTAGGKDQRVEDGARSGHSRFTAALLEALQQGLADRDGDGYVTFPELQAYVLSKAATSLQTPATAYLPGHGLGEYWFAVPGTGERAVARTEPAAGVRRDALNTADSSSGQDATANPDPPGGSAANALAPNTSAGQEDNSLTPSAPSKHSLIGSILKAPIRVLTGPPGFEPLGTVPTKAWLSGLARPRDYRDAYILNIGPNPLVVAHANAAGVSAIEARLNSQAIARLTCGAFQVQSAMAHAVDATGATIPNVDRVTISSLNGGDVLTYFTSTLSDKDRLDTQQALEALCR